MSQDGSYQVTAEFFLFGSFTPEAKKSLDLVQGVDDVLQVLKQVGNEIREGSKKRLTSFL